MNLFEKEIGSRCSAACINLLSSSSRIAIPASVSPFLVKLLHNASRSLCADSIRPVYKVLSGSGSHLLGSLAPDIVARMQDQFKEMLQKVKIELEGNCANLFCLAILAVISSGDFLDPRQEREKSSHLASATAARSTVGTVAGRSEARQFFVSKRAPKTLDLVVLKMIYACSKSCKLSILQIVESLQLSNVILEAIDEEDRATWMEKNQAKVGKLIEKVTSHTHSPEVLSTAMQSIVTLFGDRPLPEALSPAWRLSLRIPAVSNLSCGLCVKILPLLDESAVQECLLSLLEATDDNRRTTASSRDIEAAIVLVESFAVSVTSSTTTRHKILYLLSTNALADPLRRFVSLHKNGSFDQSSDGHKDRCPHSYTERQHLLRQKICTMLLKTSFFSQHDTLSLDQSTASALLDTIVGHAKTYLACQSNTNVSHSRTPALVSLFETGSTPCSATEWRVRVKNELSQNAEYQYQGIVRTMEDVCQDLERRCKEVEAPLRDEKARSMKLQAELDESRLRVANLSSHTHEQSLVLEGIEREKSELLARIADLEHEHNELFGRTEDLRQELGKAIEQAEDADRNRSKNIREFELVQAAVVAEKDEILEAQERKNKDSKAREDQLEEDVMKLRANVSMHQNKIGHLEATISEQQTELRSAHILINEKQDTLDRLDELLDHSRTDRGNLQTEVARLSDACRELRSELEDKAATVESQSAELITLRSRDEAELSAQSHKLAQLRQSSDERAEELQQLLSKQAEDAALTALQRDSRIVQLEDEFAKLKGDLEDRDNELEEAQALNDQVMAFWSKQRRRNAAAEEPPEQRSSTTPGIPPHKRTSVRFPKESPEHKRSRTARPSSSSALSRSNTRMSGNRRDPATCSKATPIRRPLADVDAGLQTRRKTSPTRSSPRKGTPKQLLDAGYVDENTQPGMAEGSVCDSDFFASTDQQLIDDIHDDAPQFGLPDDTTEF
ncbi:MAG: hypothetical protein Q9226_003173 [Calogaya cf. arnoldii]